MKLPYMRAAGNKTKRQMIAFGGINYGTDTRDGELAECTNLSAALFPYLSQREGRTEEAAYSAPTGLYARGRLCIVDGTDFIYGDTVVGTVTAGEKQFATINTKIVIFPDKAYYDTETGVFGSLGAEYTIHGDASFTKNTLKVTLAQSYNDREQDGTATVRIPAGASVTAYTGASVNKTSGTLTMSGGTAKTTETLASGDLIQYGLNSAKEYMKVLAVEGPAEDGGEYAVTGELHEVVLHKYQKLDEVFRAGDAVEISGCTDRADNNGSHIIRKISGDTLTFTENVFTQTGTETGTVRLERKVPDLSCICECDNRIWGAEGTTIYASALGDPTNFFVYDGLSTDSYAVAVGTDGDFTGCAPYSSTVLFWKENALHKVLGSYPAQYEVYTYTVPGVQAGSEKSLCVINEALLYKGRNGVYAYTGGTPELISESFGMRRFSDAVAGSDGQRYYISMKDEDGEWSLYVYDTLRGIWLREDGAHAADFAYLDGSLYYMEGKTGKLIKTGQSGTSEGMISWSAEFCQMDETTHGKKGYSKLYLRADMEAGAWLKVEISTDGGPFRQVFVSHNERAKTEVIPILPERCDSFRIRLSGKGKCTVKSLVREFSVGSEY